MSSNRPTEKRVFCPGCGNELREPDLCYCGEVELAHNGWTGHPFVPMGCDCLRNTEQERTAPAGPREKAEVLQEVSPGVWVPAVPLLCPCFQCRFRRWRESLRNWSPTWPDRLYWWLISRGWRFKE